MTSFGEVFRGNEMKTRSLGWALTQPDRCPCSRRKEDTALTLPLPNCMHLDKPHALLEDNETEITGGHTSEGCWRMTGSLPALPRKPDANAHPPRWHCVASQPFEGRWLFRGVRTEAEGMLEPGRASGRMAPTCPEIPSVLPGRAGCSSSNAPSYRGMETPRKRSYFQQETASQRPAGFGGE